METGNINAVETLARPDAISREPAPRPETASQPEKQPETRAYQVELSDEARAKQEADQAALEQMSKQQDQTATYNSSGEIGG
jgi:hypothetical protein